MEKIWFVYVDSNYATALFSTAKAAYEYLLDILSDKLLAEDPTAMEYWEGLAKNLTADYNRGDEEFGCDYCWAKAGKGFKSKRG